MKPLWLLLFFSLTVLWKTTGYRQDSWPTSVQFTTSNFHSVVVFFFFFLKRFRSIYVLGEEYSREDSAHILSITPAVQHCTSINLGDLERQIKKGMIKIYAAMAEISFIPEYK